MAFCALIVISCEYGLDAGLKINVSAQEVSHDKGHVYLDIKCPTAWTLYLVTPDGRDVDWAYLEDGAESGDGNKELIILYYEKNKGTEDRTLKIVLDNGTDWVESIFTQKCERTTQEPEDPEMSIGAVKLSKKAWMELPALNNPDLGYFSHSFEMKDRTTGEDRVYRNYSFGWSQKDRVALWVAYPLCSMYINGSAGRTNAWALDPLLGKDSAAPFGGYGGDYARGHQLPSADRQCCYDANAQTFYGTNMTPQLNEHNSGIWVHLEDAVRGYAKTSDTTYVVTGVIVSESSRIEKDSYGKNVTVPDAYFKALLKYNEVSTLGKWNAIAFYLEHKNYKNELLGKAHALSIDALEEMTGIDFFVNLPAMVGEEKAATIEATDPTKVAMWW